MACINRPKLPYDVIQEVVQMVHNGSPPGWNNTGYDERLHFLVTLSKVSLMFSNLCRRYIFEAIRADKRNGFMERFLRMVQTLKAMPSLVPFVRKLSIHYVNWNEYTPILERSTIEAVLCSLTRLRSLILYDTRKDQVAFYVNIAKSALEKATLEELILHRSLSDNLPMSTILSCPSLHTLKVSGHPEKWTGLATQPSPSNITHLSIGKGNVPHPTLDLSILDYLPMLQRLSIEELFRISSPEPNGGPASTRRRLLPSFGLKALTLTYCYFYDFEVVETNPFLQILRYYSSRAQSIGASPFAEMEAFSCTIVMETDIEPVHGILERAPLLKSLTIDFTFSTDETMPSLSTLDIPILIRDSFLSLTTLILRVFTSCDVANANETLHNDLHIIFSRIYGHNSLEHIDLYMQIRDLKGIPANMAGLVRPFGRVFQSSAGYPKLKQLDLKYTMMTRDPLISQDTVKSLTDSVNDGMKELRERGGVRLLIAVDIPEYAVCPVR